MSDPNSMPVSNNISNLPAQQKGADPVDWVALVPLVLHPIKVAIIEALRWVDEPISATDVHRMYAEPKSVPVVAYHLRTLAFVLPVLDIHREEEISPRMTRKLYYFRGRAPASEQAQQAA